MFYYLMWTVGGLKSNVNCGKIKLRNLTELKILYVTNGKFDLNKFVQ